MWAEAITEGYIAYPAITASVRIYNSNNVVLSSNVVSNTNSSEAGVNTDVSSSMNPAYAKSSHSIMVDYSGTMLSLGLTQQF